MGNISDRWSVHPLGKKSQNGTSFQDYLRQVGFQPVIKTDNTQSGLKKWTDHFQQHCIGKPTIETHSPWGNPAETNIV